MANPLISSINAKRQIQLRELGDSGLLGNFSFDPTLPANAERVNAKIAELKAPPKKLTLQEQLLAREKPEQNIAQQIFAQGAGAVIGGFERFTGTRERGDKLTFTPTRGYEKFLLGTKPISSLKEQGRETLLSFGVSDENASKYGGTLAVGLLGLDLFTGGRGKGLTTTLRALKVANTAEDATKILIRTGVTDDLAKLYAPRFASMRSTFQISRELKALKSVAQGKAGVGKLVIALEEAKPVRNAQQALQRVERGKRAAKIERIGAQVGGEAGFRTQLGALKGKLPTARYEAIRKSFTQTEIDGLFDVVQETSTVLPFEKITAKGALVKLFEGAVPTRSELSLLREVFGNDLTRAILKNRPLGQKIFEGIAEVINVPRALMASFDLSAPFRQGLLFTQRPKRFASAFKEMFKYAFSDKAYDGLMANIKARSTYKLMREGGLDLTDIKSLSLTGREERFMSNLAQQIPGLGRIVKGSDRAYTGFLNKLRADVFDDLITKGNRLGIEQTDKYLKDAARFVNTATGRGGLGGLEPAAVALNSVLFSPKLMASRLNLMNPIFYASLHPTIRKEALKNLLTLGATATTVAGLLKLNGADIESDPRSADFMKAKFGNTRYDFLGGFQQYIRLSAQLVSGQVLSSTSGRTITLGEGYRPLTRWEVLIRFLENKESPIASLATGLMKGESAIGGDFRLSAEIANRLIPMVTQDMYDLYREDGLVGIVESLPAVFGVGMQTYGRQELIFGEDKFGKDTSQIRPIPGVGEAIANKLFGELPLESTRGYSVETFVKQLQALPSEEARDVFDSIGASNEVLAEKIATFIKEEEAGITPHDRDLKQKGVVDGSRSEAIYDELAKLETDEERKELWAEYTRKRVITKEVAEQLYLLLR